MVVYGIGHAMVDIFCISATQELSFDSLLENPLIAGEVAHILPQEMDLLLNNITNQIPDFCPLSNKVRVSGGTAANILKAASLYGADCTFYGATGTINNLKDDNSLFFQKDLAQYGVKSFLTSETEPTGRFLVIQTKKNRYYAASPAAAKKIDLRHINEQDFAKADFVVIEGMLCLNERVFSRLIELCITYGVIPVIDAASPFACKKAVPEGLEKLGHMPFIFFANETECAVIEKSINLNFADYAKNLCAKNERSIIIQKMGERGAKAFFFNQKTECKTVRVKALDSTGAGDVFAGAFLYALSQNFQTAKNYVPTQSLIITALQFANKAAARVLNVYGCKLTIQSTRY